MQYDDLTLIKFTDGELEAILTKEIENAALNDRKLQERLKVISLMSNEKIILSQKYGQKLNQKIADISISEETVSDDVPSHVVDLIKNFKPSFNQRLEALIYKVRTKYKTLTAFISSIIAVLIWFSLPPLMITRSVDFLEGSSFWSSALKIVLSYRGFFWN